MLQVVWFKRDLRIYDNEALSRACAAGPVLCIYVLEPEYWSLKDTSDRQWQFIRESLDDLSAQHWGPPDGTGGNRHGSAVRTAPAYRKICSAQSRRNRKSVDL